MELENKNVIITGGASGIGLELVEKLLEKKARICVLDNNLGLLKELKNNFPEVFCKPCDVSNYEEVEIVIAECFKEFGTIDVLVNNAALIYNSLLIGFGKNGRQKHNVEMWKKVINTDLNSVFYLTVNVVDKMIEKRTKGVIINVSSIAAAGNIGQSAYSAAKAGINALTVTWAKELAVWKIRVAGIAPGFVETDTTLNSIEKNVAKDWKKKTPLQRMANTKEIVSGILFVIHNDFYNGRIMEIDGGLRI